MLAGAEIKPVGGTAVVFPHMDLVRDVWKIDPNLQEPKNLDGVEKERWEAGAEALEDTVQTLHGAQIRFDSVCEEMQTPRMKESWRQIEERIQKENPGKEFKVFLFGLKIPFNDATDAENHRSIPLPSPQSVIFEVRFAEPKSPVRYFLPTPAVQRQGVFYAVQEVQWHRAFSEQNKIVVRFVADNPVAEALGLEKERMEVLKGGVGAKMMGSLKAKRDYGIGLTALESLHPSQLVTQDQKVQTFREYVEDKMEFFNGLLATIAKAEEKKSISPELAKKAKELLDWDVRMFEQVIAARRRSDPGIENFTLHDIEINSPKFSDQLVMSHAFGPRFDAQGVLVGYSLVDLWTGQRYEVDLADGATSPCDGLEAAWETFLNSNYYKELDRSYPTFAHLQDDCRPGGRSANASANQLLPNGFVEGMNKAVQGMFEAVTLAPLFDSPYAAVEGDEPYLGFYTLGNLVGGGLLAGVAKLRPFRPASSYLLQQAARYPWIGAVAIAGAYTVNQFGLAPSSEEELEETLSEIDPAKLTSALAAGIPVTRLLYTVKGLNWVAAAVGILVMGELVYDKYHRISLEIKVDPAEAASQETFLKGVMQRIEAQ